MCANHRSRVTLASTGSLICRCFSRKTHNATRPPPAIYEYINALHSSHLHLSLLTIASRPPTHPTVHTHIFKIQIVISNMQRPFPLGTQTFVPRYDMAPPTEPAPQYEMNNISRPEKAHTQTPNHTLPALTMPAPVPATSADYMQTQPHLNFDAEANIPAANTRNNVSKRAFPISNFHSHFRIFPPSNTLSTRPTIQFPDATLSASPDSSSWRWHSIPSAAPSHSSSGPSRSETKPSQPRHSVQSAG